MNKLSYYILICFILASVGCIRVHPGRYAKQIDQTGKLMKGKQTKLGLIISGKQNNKLSSTYFGVIDFIFENKSQEWIRIKDIKIDFGDDKIDKNVKFTSGKDFNIWLESTKKRNRIEKFNDEVVLGFISGVALGVAASTNNVNIQKKADLIALGGLASLSINEFNKNRDKIASTNIFPENHLLANEFIIPPGLFVKKFVVLNSQNHTETGYISIIFLEYRTKKGDSERLKLMFRQSYDIPKWQDNINLY